jgi:hypothetical protein
MLATVSACDSILLYLFRRLPNYFGVAATRLTLGWV